MRRRHFLAFRPVCPVCRAGGHLDHPLVIAKVYDELDDDILEGILHCSNSDCQREYPILDGIPLIVGPLRTYVSDNVLPALIRTDIPEGLESLLGDCCGPGSPFDVRRQLLSAYVWDHYGDCDVDSARSNPAPGSIVRTLREVFNAADPLPDGPMIDMGCSVGRTTFELAEHHNQLTLGVDLNFSMLQVASRALRTGRVRYARRRVGVIYDRREFSYSSTCGGNVDFWACDLLALPFAPQSLSAVLALNVLDCVSEPRKFLKSSCLMLMPGGKLILSTPFDWSPSATSVESWLGGHSQRSPDRGAPETFIRKLLSDAAPGHTLAMSLVKEWESIPWQVRLHDRATMSYSMNLLMAEKQRNAVNS